MFSDCCQTHNAVSTHKVVRSLQLKGVFVLKCWKGNARGKRWERTRLVGSLAWAINCTVSHGFTGRGCCIRVSEQGADRPVPAARCCDWKPIMELLYGIKPTTLPVHTHTHQIWYNLNYTASLSERWAVQILYENAGWLILSHLSSSKNKCNCS